MMLLHVEKDELHCFKMFQMSQYLCEIIVKRVKLLEFRVLSDQTRMPGLFRHFLMHKCVFNDFFGMRGRRQNIDH